MAALLAVVSDVVRVPKPVYDRIVRESDRQDVPRGVIVRDWMDKADKFEEMEARNR